MEDDAEDQEFLSQVVGCRLSASDHAALQPFFETFPGRHQRPSVSKAMRWLLSQPSTIEAMNARIAERTRPAR